MQYSRLATWALVFIVIADMTTRLNSFIGASNGSTILIALLNCASAAALVILWSDPYVQTEVPPWGRRIFMAVIIWGSISFVHGAFGARDYWGWKTLILSHLFIVLVPFAIVVGLRIEYFVSMLVFLCKVIFPLGLLLVPWALADDVQLVPRFVAPVMLILLLALYLPTRWKLLIALTALASVMIDVSYRTNLIRFLSSAALIVLVLLQSHWIFRAYRTIVLVVFALPLVLLWLGVTGQFNVFSENTFSYDVVSRKDKVVDVVDLNVDTRTFLYKEVFLSMRNRGSSFLVGEGGSAGYDTEHFDEYIVSDQGRAGSEVGFLNTLLHQGIIGVCLYAAMLLYASSLAMRHSNNVFCRTVGVFLMVRWVLFFIEDIPAFDLNNFTTWVAIGLCLSKSMRGLTDLNLRDLLSGAFSRPTSEGVLKNAGS